jgi:hypothetical protein
LSKILALSPLHAQAATRAAAVAAAATRVVAAAAAAAIRAAAVAAAATRAAAAEAIRAEVEAAAMVAVRTPFPFLQSNSQRCAFTALLLSCCFPVAFLLSHSIKSILVCCFIYRRWRRWVWRWWRVRESAFSPASPAAFYAGVASLLDSIRFVTETMC